MKLDFSVNEPASCTALSTFEQDIATVGEDGRINLLTAQQKNPVRTIGNSTVIYMNEHSKGSFYSKYVFFI